MRKGIALLLVVVCAFSVGFYRTKAQNKAFNLVVTAPTVYRAGDSLNITISVCDIKLEGGMSYVSFRLYYDSTKAVPIIKNGFTDETENRSTFILNCPDFESWEVVGFLDEEECFYELTFGTDRVTGLRAAKVNNSLVFSIPFTIRAGTQGDVWFFVPEEYVRGGNASLTQIEVPGGANDAVTKDTSFNYTTGVNNISDSSVVSVVGDKPLSILSDGDKALSSTSGNDSGVVLFRNLIDDSTGYTELLLVLESEKTINTISICFFYDSDSGIGLPKNGKVLVSYSPNSTTFSIPADYNLNLDVRGTKGVAEAILILEKPERIKYLKIAIPFGNHEFIGLTELQAYYKIVDEGMDPLELTSTSKLRIEDGYLLGLPDKVTVEKIKSNFKNEVTVSGTGTGSTVTAGGKTLVIIIAGDLNGDGKISSIDCMKAKKVRLGTITLTPAEMKAACIQGASLPTLVDIMRMKKHILGFDYIHDHS